MSRVRVSVLGAGPGGLATAAGIASKGHSVTLYSRTEARLAPVVARGGIAVDEREELIRLSAVTVDLADAVQDADVVLVAVPAFGQEGLVAAAAPHLRGDAVLVLMPGSCGSLAVLDHLTAGAHDVRRGLLLAETVTLPYSGRLTGEAEIRVRLASRLRAAAFPASRTHELIERMAGILDLVPARHVLDPGLNNPNFLIHPAPMLLNYAEIERRDGLLSIMNEGMTPGVLRCLDAMDREKMAICARLGLVPVSIDEIYRGAGASPDVYRSPGEPFNLTDRIWERYVTEDVPFGSVLLASFGAYLGVDTSVCAAVSELLVVARGEGPWPAKRTVATLGIQDLGVDQLIEYLETGESA